MTARLAESWRQYKEIVMSKAPGIARRVLAHKHFDRLLFYCLLVAVLYFLVSTYAH
jgi:hypothetical protein